MPFIRIFILSYFRLRVINRYFYKLRSNETQKSIDFLHFLKYCLFQIYPDEPDEKQNSKRKEKSGLTCVLVGLTIRIVLDLIKFHLGEFLNSKPGALSSTGV